MIGDDKLIAFREDVIFANWQDTLNTYVNKQRKHDLVVAEFKVNGLKMQVVHSYGMYVQFLSGNKIEDKIFILSVIEDSNFEAKVADFFQVSFGTGREIYRSMMSNAIKHFRV